MDIDFLPCGAAKRGPVGALHIVPTSAWFKRQQDRAAATGWAPAHHAGWAKAWCSLCRWKMLGGERVTLRKNWRSAHRPRPRLCARCASRNRPPREPI